MSRGASWREGLCFGCPPIYYVRAQLSRTIRPSDKAVQAHTHLEDLDDDALHSSATINGEGLLTQLLNTTRAPIRFSLQTGAQYTDVEIEANSLQTIRVQLQDISAP